MVNLLQINVLHILFIYIKSLRIKNYQIAIFNQNTILQLVKLKMPTTTYINSLPKSEIDYVVIFENDHNPKDSVFMITTSSEDQYKYPLNYIDRFLNLSSGKTISQNLENQLYQHCAAWIKRDENNEYKITPLLLNHPNQKIEMQIKQNIEDITKLLTEIPQYNKEATQPKMLYLKQQSSHINDTSLTL